MQLEVHHLSKVYKEKRGLLATDFNVDHGELIAVVGHNERRRKVDPFKTAGWLAGSRRWRGPDRWDFKNRRALVRKIGFVPETPNLFDFFSVEYNLTLFARLFQISA
jgi:ABC-type multidrug transport system ATPase subunit